MTITKEEILLLATGMAGRIFSSDNHGDANIEEVVQDCFTAILHVAQKENIRIEDGPARKDPIILTPKSEIKNKKFDPSCPWCSGTGVINREDTYSRRKIGDRCQCDIIVRHQEPWTPF
jgi:hypothetical protein